MDKLTCLRCKHAQMVGSDNTEVIRCGKQKNKVVDINLVGCPLTDPDWASKGGDKIKSISPLEELFLKKHFTAHTISNLALITQRSERAIKDIGYLLHLKPIVPKRQYSHKNAYTLEQRKFLLEQITTGNWPLNYILSKEDRARENQIKKFILRKVAELGPPRTWKQLVYWKYSQKKPYKRKNDTNTLL